MIQCNLDLCFHILTLYTLPFVMKLYYLCLPVKQFQSFPPPAVSQLPIYRWTPPGHPWEFALYTVSVLLEKHLELWEIQVQA